MTSILNPKEPLVSVVMPAYNSETLISESIRSVLDQSYTNFELIVVNDGSTDATGEIVETFTNIDRRIRLCELGQNRGLSFARNEGCRQAKGEFVAFLDSDDLWSKEKLWHQIQFHIKHPSVNISHTNFAAFDSRGTIKRPWKRLLEPISSKQGNLYPRLCYKNTVGILTVMIKKELLVRIGLFDENLWTFEDQDLWIRVSKNGEYFGYINEVLGLYRISPGGLSKRTGKYKRAYKRFIYKTLKNGEINTTEIWRNYYRFFGTVYFKKKEFRLSRIYFTKSLELVVTDLVSVSTIAYLGLTLIKEAQMTLRSYSIIRYDR